MKITLPADHAVDAEVDLGPKRGLQLAARLYVVFRGWSARRRSALSRRPTWCAPIREQRTGTSPSKRRWSEAAPMRANSEIEVALASVSSS